MASTWRAPPTIANLGPGFDVLGVAIASIEHQLGQEDWGDAVTARTTGEVSGVRLTEINPNRDNLPLEGNVAEVVGRYIAEKAGYTGGIALKLKKNMRVGTGMGSSASSAVASAMAVNDALALGFPPYARDSRVILDAVVAGEAAAIKKEKGHADNVFPALLGGFVYVGKANGNFVPRKIASGFSKLYFVVVHPDVVVNTGEARDALAEAPYDIGGLVEASRRVADAKHSMLLNLESLVKPGGQINDVINYLAGFRSLIQSIKAGDVKQFGMDMMTDNIVTPVRAEFIPGYYDLKESALGAGAYGFTIGGSGPTVISVTDKIGAAYRIGEANLSVLRRRNVPAEMHVCTVDANGAQRIAAYSKSH